MQKEQGWEGIRAWSHQGIHALAIECKDACCGWSVDEESTHGHVSSSRAAASVNTHTSQGTAQPQAQAGKGDLSGGQEPGVTQEHARFVIAGMAWHKEEIYN